MTDLKLKYPEGATPLNLDELNGLKIDYITTQGELNTLEQENIIKAVTWMKKNLRKAQVLTEDFIRKLHTKMFNDVWEWAGTYRKSDKSIGIPWPQILTSIVNLCEDTQCWIDHQAYSWDEIGARFHHRLVQIHLFPNGNGRHARLMTDALLISHDQEPFSWGAKNKKGDLASVGQLRSAYISALQEADRKKYKKLIKFVRE